MAVLTISTLARPAGARCSEPPRARQPLRFGIQTPQQNMSWEEMRRLWLEAERLGFDSAWVFDHLMPVFGRDSGPTLEAWTLLAALAASTSRLRVGCLVTSNTFRHPALLAKMAATVDHLSGGRLELGVGAGWYEKEHRAYGIPFYTARERAQRLAEAVQLIHALWTPAQSSFEGRYYRLKDAPFEPRPLQQPHPPIMIGGGGRKWTLPVVARYADAWNCPLGHPPESAAALSRLIDRYCRAIGRGPQEIERSVFLPLALGKSRAHAWMSTLGLAAHRGTWPWRARQHMLVGPPARVIEQVQRYADVGFTHFILVVLPTYDPVATMRLFAAEVMPAFGRP